MKSTKNADPDKYRYSGYGIGFDAHSRFSVNGEWDKNFIISVYIIVYQRILIIEKKIS